MTTHHHHAFAERAETPGTRPLCVVCGHVADRPQVCIDTGDCAAVACLPCISPERCGCDESETLRKRLAEEQQTAYEERCDAGHYTAHLKEALKNVTIERDLARKQLAALGADLTRVRVLLRELRPIVADGTVGAHLAALIDEALR